MTEEAAPARERAEGEPSASEPEGAAPLGRQSEVRATSPGGALKAPGGERAKERRYPHPTSAARSANMKGNRRADTKPELALRRALHGQGYRYRKDYRLDLGDGVRVRPDIVFTARRIAVFVDGCFWHCCPEHGSQPAANTWYWEPKLRRNVERDRAADAALGHAGWTVVRLWEHESLEAAVAAVVHAVKEAPGRMIRGSSPADRWQTPLRD